MTTIEHCNALLAENTTLRQQRDELAAQVEAMRGALSLSARHFTVFQASSGWRAGEEKALEVCNTALALPNTTAILRQRDAMVLREMAERLCDYYATGGAAVDAVRIIRKAANEVENGK